MLGDADVGDHQLAHVVPTRKQEVTGLGAVKSDGQSGMRRSPHHRAGVAVHPRWDVDRDHRHVGPAQPPRSYPAPCPRAGGRGRRRTARRPPARRRRPTRGRGAAPRPATPRPPWRRRRAAARARRAGRPAPASRARRDAAPPRSRRRRCCRGRTARAPGGRQPFGDRPGDRRARVLHELDARHPRGDRGGIGGAHFGDGEEAAVPAGGRRAWCQPHRAGRPPIRRWRDGRTSPARSPRRPAGRH